MTAKKECKKNGRPTLYDEEFHCKSFVELSTCTDEHLPHTLVQIAHKWKVNEDTIREWGHRHLNFSAALLAGRAAHKSWFNDQVKLGLYDESNREGSRRLNTNAVKLYAYMCFGVTEKKGSYIDFPIEYKTATFERRAEILIEMLADRKISDEQYERLDRVLTAQQQRAEGREILEAYEKMKQIVDDSK